MRRLLFVGALVAIAGACGDSNELTPDAGPDIRFDAAPPPDVPETPDAGPPPGTVGEACREDGDCNTGELCVDFPGGYCTADCGSMDCPSGSSCVQVDRATFLCLADCDPSAEDPCRAGYGCTTDPSLGNVCIPGCTSNDDCSEGLECDEAGGAAGEGACFDPGAEVGDACEEDTECPSGNFCFREGFGGWPGGACVAFGCDPVANTGCGEGATCVEAGGGDGICIASCEDAGDCREGYDCVSGACRAACEDSDQCSEGRVCNPAVGTCASAFDPSLLGNTCSGSRRACLGGTCFSEFASGFPGSYCVYRGCNPAATDATDGCPGDGVCAVVDGEPVCLDACAGDTCREGYDCRLVDPTNEASGTACVPACTSDDACANDGTDGAPDFSCNPGTGLCTDPFVTDRLGFMCTTAEDCPGGRCLDEASTGYPAGTCVALGCRLSGEGPAQPCPTTGGVCVDDGVAPSDVGMCLDACVIAMSGACRANYACVALTEGSPEGACRPACAEGACGDGRVCDAETGLCEPAT